MTFKYKPRSREQMETRKSATASDFIGIFKDGTKTLAIKDNQEHAIRIMPPNWDDAEHYGMDVYIHYSVGPDNATILCPAKHHNKPCPVCELRARLQASGDEEGAKELRAGKAVAMYVIDRDNEKEGVLAWRAPFSLDADFMRLCVDDRTGEVYNIDDPADGYDLFFTTEGKALQRKYKGVKLARKPSSVAKKHLDYIEAHPLPDILNFLSYKAIEKALGGAGVKSRRDDEDEDDRKPAKRGRARDDDDEDEDDRKPVKAKRRPADDEDDEDEAPKTKRRSARDDDDDEDEDEAPKKKRRVVEDDDDDEPPAKAKRRRPADDDDEDEDEAPKTKRRSAKDDDDEDEEDEAPKKKRRPADDDDDDEDDVPFDKAKKVKKPVDDDDDEPKSQVRQRLADRKRR